MFLSLTLLIIVILVIIFLSVSFYIAVFKAPFVPTTFPAVHEVLEAAKIKPGEKVYDIGAGDNRFIHFAVKDYKAKGTGFEIDPFVYFLAKIRQWIWRWKGEIKYKSFFNHDFSDADVVLCYMLPKILKKFQPKLQKELRKGARIVSYTFHVGNLKPTKIIPKKGKVNRILIYEIK